MRSLQSSIVKIDAAWKPGAASVKPIAMLLALAPRSARSNLSDAGGGGKERAGHARARMVAAAEQATECVSSAASAKEVASWLKEARVE